MAHLTLRIELGDHEAVGHGKIRLLELIGELGSISAAGRAMGMSYRRAWLLIDSVNKCFKQAAVHSSPGGTGGGGATLTPFGRTLIRHFRKMEKAAGAAAAAELAALERARNAIPLSNGVGKPRRRARNS